MSTYLVFMQVSFCTRVSTEHSQSRKGSSRIQIASGKQVCIKLILTNNFIILFNTLWRIDLNNFRTLISVLYNVQMIRNDQELKSCEIDAVTLKKSVTEYIIILFYHGKLYGGSEYGKSGHLCLFSLF